EMDEPNRRKRLGSLLDASEKSPKALDKEREVGFIKTAESSERKHNRCSFCDKGTLTTEEWKAELELEAIRISFALAQFLSILSFRGDHGERTSANKPSNNMVQLGSRTTMQRETCPRLG